MPRFNAPTRTIPDTTNLAGGRAYSESPKLELVTHLLTSFVQYQFYRDANTGMERLVELANMVDAEFAAKAAIYAREQFGMRSVTHVLACELADRISGTGKARDFYGSLPVRVDDITEMLAYWQAKHGDLKHLRSGMRKGLADALTKFDSYQLAKYKAEGKSVSLVDAVNVLHPNPTDKETFKALMNGELKESGTWESEISAAGKDTDKRGFSWHKLLSERKIGYFALLRNLRNILNEGNLALTSMACELLQDERLIRQSRVLPFRYLTAKTEIEKLTGPYIRETLSAIDGAFDIAVGNVPNLKGRTLIALDDSGSMQQGGAIEKAVPLAAVMYASQDADMVLFSDSLRAFNASIGFSASAIMTLLKREVGRGGGTNFNLIFDHAEQKYGRIVILSDMQGWQASERYHAPWGGAPDASFRGYKQRTGIDPFVYSWDLQGYGTLQFPESKVFALAGFSEKVFEVMGLLEEDREAMVHRIESVQP